MARVYKKVSMQPPLRTPSFPSKSASANAPIFLPRPGLNMLRFGVAWYYVACPTRGIGKSRGGGRGEVGGGKTFRDISTTAAFRRPKTFHDRDTDTYFIGIRRRRIEGWKWRFGGELKTQGDGRGLVRRTRNSSRFVNAQGARLPGTY